MTFRPWTQWPADEPPPDFTDRMVGRLLEASEPLPRPARSRRRWVMGLALAAVLAATSAWAVMQYARQHAAVPEPPAVEQPAAAPQPSPSPSPVVGALAPAPSASEPEEPAPVASPARVKAKPPASASAPVPPASASARHVIVPRCECGPASVICTCVE